MSGSLPEPIAEGDLLRTPFAHVLLYAQRHELTGSLVLWNPDVPEGRPQQDRIRFEAGKPTAAVLLERASRLDRGLLPLFGRRNGPYAFYPGVDLVTDAPNARAGEVEVLPLIAASLRGSTRDDVVQHVVRGFGDEPLRIRSGVNLADFGLLPKERVCLDLLRAEPVSITKLTELSQLPARTVARLIYLFAIARAVEVWDGAASKSTRQAPRPAAAKPRERPAAPEKPASRERPRSSRGSSIAPGTPDALPPMPAGLSPEHQALWLEIESRAEAIESENYFEMLGVPRDVGAGSVQKAYFKLVKKWHPDRLPRELTALRPAVERIFGYLTRAQELLSDDAQRGTYLSNVQAGGGTPEADRELALIVQAAMEFRKVEVMLRRREWDAALELLDELLTYAAEEPDYHATRGWVLFSKTGGDVATRASVIASLNKALELSPDHDKAHYYMGVVLKRANQNREALEHFRASAKANPKNIEAVREVRIAEMRSEAPGPKSSDAGDKRTLLGKLFGGKKK